MSDRIERCGCKKNRKHRSDKDVVNKSCNLCEVGCNSYVLNFNGKDIGEFPNVRSSKIYGYTNNGNVVEILTTVEITKWLFEKCKIVGFEYESSVEVYNNGTQQQEIDEIVSCFEVKTCNTVYTGTPQNLLDETWVNPTVYYGDVNNLDDEIVEITFCLDLSGVLSPLNSP